MQAAFLLSLVVLSLTTMSSGFPFQTCPGAPTDLNIQTLDICPDPPVKGSSINLGLSGVVDEQLTNGSNFEVDVLLDNVPIFTETVDLSEATTLPVGPGSIALNYSVAIPQFAPSGSYRVQLTFSDQSNTEIGCVDITFSL